MSFSATKFHSSYIWLLVVLLRLGGAQDVADDSELKDVHVQTQASLFPTTIDTGTFPITPAHGRLRRAPANELGLSCTAPPKPVNGEYKLDFCVDTTKCNASEGTRLDPGSKLVYRCNSGYRPTRNTDVYCSVRGEWSTIPECVEVRCESLTSESTSVTCTRFGSWVNCDSPVPPQTRAEVTCRHGYKKDTDFITTRRTVVNCNIKGQWEPKPIKCVPVCGRTITHQQPLVFGGSPAKIGDFPWHTSLFRESRSPKGNKKHFVCGGTIIKTNLVLTAAHCIYDEVTKTTEDPSRLFVITGNIFRDYDSPAHNPAIVRNASVKNVYTNCNYYGLIGNYGSDIALLELEKPFEFSSILLPACLDDSGFSDQSLEPGAYGKVAGFGRTETGTTSGILQTLTLPYISYSECKASSDADRNEAFISSDKFCAGYNNGSSVCEGDSGGGLVFKKGDLWYVMGIVSVGLGVDLDNGEKTCDKYSYSLYTKVSSYMTWIQDVLFYLERKLPYPSCSPNSHTSTPSTALDYDNTYVPVYCKVPPHPPNGELTRGDTYCNQNEDCVVVEGTEVEPSSSLYIHCASEFIALGATVSVCYDDGNWSSIMTCTNASCSLKDGSPGRCTRLKNCQSVREDVENGKQPDTVCDSLSNHEIVCCPLPPPAPTEPAGDGRGAIARQKCAEYAQTASPSKCPWSAADGEEPLTNSPTGRLWPNPMEFPHLAAIGFPLSWDPDSVSWDCGGTLISGLFVLTSASCIDAKPLGNATMVRVGILDHSDYEERRIAERILHPDYKPPSEYNDIGLVRLEAPISFDGWIRPACLHTSPVVVARTAVTTKWGYTDHESDSGSTSLFKVNLPIVDLPICQSRWSSAIRKPEAKRITGSAVVVKPDDSKQMLAKGINGDWFICAGATGKKTCYGDPGGSLVTRKIGTGNELCMYDVIGVLNVVRNCGARIPALYTRVYYHVPWIESVVWRE